jgi:hypothetical protein
MSSLVGALLGGEAKDGERIEADPLKFSGAAGIGGVMVALAGAIPAVLEAVDALNLSDTQLIGVLALIAAGTIAFAIASAGDALARAYSSAWVLPKKDAKEGRPAQDARPALAELAEAVAHLGTNGAGGELVLKSEGRELPVTSVLVREGDAGSKSEGRELPVKSVVVRQGDAGSKSEARMVIETG